MKSTKTTEEIRPRGRPAYRPTIEARRSVEELKFCGESDCLIARAIGIDVATLNKHFADELADGHANRRREIVGLLFESARNGNVSAQRRLDEIGRSVGEQNDGGAAAARVTPKLGKKEQALLDARTPDTSTEIGELMARRTAGGPLH